MAKQEKIYFYKEKLGTKYKRRDGKVFQLRQKGIKDNTHEKRVRYLFCSETNETIMLSERHHTTWTRITNATNAEK